jgi:hypothetical protein
MHVELLYSTADFRKLQKRQRRRVAKLKCEGSEVQITFIGGWYRARITGSNVVAFGETPSEALQRLGKLEAMRSVCIPKSIDLHADKLEQRGRAE